MLHQRHLCVDGRRHYLRPSTVYGIAHDTHHISYTMLTVTWCRSECCMCAIRTPLQSHWRFRCTLLSVQLFASRASSCCKHDMGALSWLNVKTLKRAPTSLPSLADLCKVLCPWVLLHKTMVRWTGSDSLTTRSWLSLVMSVYYE